MDASHKPTANELAPIEIDFLDRTLVSTAFAGCLPDDLAAAVADGVLAAFGAAAEGKAAGVLVFQITGNVAVVPWLYVLPAFRRQYIASSLLGELLDFLQSDAFDLSIQAIALEYSDDAEGLWPFLAAAGFEQEGLDDVSLGTRLENLPACDFMQKPPALPAELTLVPLSSLSEVHLRALSAALLRDEADYTGLPFTADNFLLDLGVAAYHNGEIAGCVALSRQGEDRVALSVFYTTSKTPALPLCMLHAAGTALLKSFPGSTLLEIPVLSQSAGKLAQRLLGAQAQQVARMVRARLELLAPMPEE